jgi:subtilisin-like proprotein convertase family protein
MFLPWSLITGRPKTAKNTPSESKQRKPLRRPQMKVEALEDRVVPANYFVDAAFAGASTGSLVSPFKTIQDALKAANANPGADNVFVYGNNSTNPAVAAYVWERDGDANLDGQLDGNLDVGTDASNPVNLFMRASVRNVASADGSGGAAANLIVKMRDNIVDVRDNSQLRLEGTNDAARVIFTSVFDDSVGGDSLGDGDTNSAQRTDWGGIRYRAEAIDQGATSATGSLINFADIRYTGATVFDETVGFNTEFGSIRMEANSLNPGNVRSAQVRVWNTVFQHGGRAIDVNINALGRGGKASSLITGPDLGAATAQGLRFVDNSINGAFIFIPADTFTGFLQQLYVNSTLDDVGVPYVVTSRFVIGSARTTPGVGIPQGQVTLTFNEGIVFKSQNTGLDGIDFGEVNDATYGTIRVNGSVNRPVLFTSLSDDGLVANTDLAALYNNGSADTNNDGNATSATPGDWGGIRIAQGNIDHATVRFGGGFAQVNGTFVNWPAIRVFARDLTPAGLNVQQVRISNTEITSTYSQLDATNPSFFADSPAIDLFSRDDGDTRFAGPNAPITRTGDVQVMDNYIHDNIDSKAIQAHPLYFHDSRNTSGGYGVFFRRNILQNNAVNGVFVDFILDLARGIDQNLPSAGGAWDDTDIVTVFEGQALIVKPDQYFAMMSRRTVVPDSSSGGYLQKFTDANTFISSLVMRMPGNNPTNLTQPLNIPLQRGPLSVNSGLVDSGLFYYQTNFDSTSRNVTNNNGALQRGEEWRDWGVNFVYAGEAGNINDPLRPFRTVTDPSNPAGLMLQTDALDGDGSYEMVFPNGVSTVGFWIVNNQSNSPKNRIELIGANGQVIETAPMPTTTANGRTFFGRISRTAIHKVRIIDEAGDSTAAASNFGGNFNVAIPDNGTNAEALINVGPSFNISDVRVNLSITHARASDLTLELVAPDGTVVPLAVRTGGTAAGANYTNTQFSDSFSTPITAGVAPFSGNFYPVSFDPFSASPTGLSVLNGKNSAGTWRLRVRDNAAGATGTINNVNITFQGAGLPLNNPGITGLTWVEAGENLVTKANSATSVITAGSIARGFANVTQDFSGVITNGFTPQMFNLANGGNAQGQFTFGRNTQTSFLMNTPTVLQAGGDTIIPLDIPATSNFVASDLTVNLNLNYAGNNSGLRVRLRAPDGSEIDLVAQNSTTGTGGFTNTTFDDQAQPNLGSLNPNTGNPFTAPYSGTFQSRSFSQTILTSPTTVTPFGLGFYRGKNVSGTWALVVTRSDAAAGTVNNFRLSFRAPTQGWGSTLRILGQGANPVLMTGIDDDTTGAGPIGNVVLDTANDGPTAASGGQWQGIQILAGVNTSVSEVVSQNPNGTLNRRYSDFNPYTRFDEGLFYPGVSNPTNVLLSTQDRLQTSLAANNAGTTVQGRAPFDSFTTANLQDGTLVEFAEIRFATIGIDQRAYPKNKLTIDGNEFEQNAQPNGSVAGGAEIIQPVPAFQINQFDQVRFGTQDGTYTVAGRLGGSGDGQFTDDVDWYELPSNTPEGRNLQLYVDVELGRRTAGTDEPNNRPVSIAVFNHQFQLIYWSGLGGGTGYSDNVGLSGNTLGPIQIQNTDVPYTADNPQRDAKYIAVMPADRVPRSFIPTTANPAGLQPDQTFYVMNPFQSDRMTANASADGGALTLLNQQGAIQVVTNDSIWDPPGASGTTIGGYEMNLRFTGFERHLNPQQPADGQVLIRSNTILNSSGDGIRLSDVRMTMSNTALGATMPLQAARFNSFAVNQSTNSNNNPYSNVDINNVNPSLSAPANFVPGPTIQNNLIINNGGNGISLSEDRNTNAISQGNRLTPTAFTQISNNTIDSNEGVGIQLTTRGGPSVQNNIVSRNGVGLNIVDGYDINNLTPPVTPVVSYNIFYANTVSTAGHPFNGTQNIIGNGAAADPQYIDPNTLDYRVRLASPAVDSAVSDLQDRLRSTRFPQEPTRAPNLDLRGRSRIDNPSRPNVGSGAFPFYDRGALETNELSLRVIGLSVLADNNILGAPISSLNIVFSGRVDLATFTSSSVSLRIGTPTGVAVPINFTLLQNTYDKNSDTHTFTLPLFNALNDGTYWLVMNGTTTGVGVRDIAGQLLDGEFPAPYNLPSGNGAAGGTFQYPFTIRTGAISGNVWRNDNGNGTIDAGEPGINAVTVRLNGPGDDGVLFTGDDVVIATQVTTASGAYNFSNVASGRYYINVVQSSLPANYRLNTPPADKVVNLGIGGIRSNVNFGYWLDSGNATVTGNIFSDLNGDGNFNPGEPAVVPSGGVTVTLTSGGADFDLSTAADNVVYTAITTPSGTYSFIGLPSNRIFGNNYRLDVDESTIPTSFVRTSPLIVPVTFFLTPGGSRVQNYGYQEKQATINGTVFNDADGSGSLNGGEVGIVNVTVSLLGAGIDGLFGTADDLPTQTTATNAAGVYSFNPLTAGTYRVVVDSASPVLNNFFLTTGNSTQDLVLASGNGTTTAANVGYRQDPLSNVIQGLVFNDLDGDGQYDLGVEPGIGGVPVQLRWAGRNNIVGDSDDQLYSVVTNGAGAYTASGLPIGNFYVSPIQVTPGPLDGFGLSGPASIPSLITLGFGQSYLGGDLSFFGYVPVNSSISGVVFDDLNGNGSIDPGETGRFGGTRVYIDANNNGIYDLGERNAVSNNGSGTYTIGSLAANAGYRLRIDTLTSPVALPAGYVPTVSEQIVGVGPSQNVVGVDFGVQQRNAVITGRVFIDLNSNGIFDPGEVGSPNQTVDLTITSDPNNIIIASATTGSDGTFNFSGLAANGYTVTTSVPVGGTVGAPGNPQSVVLAAGAGAALNFPVQFTGGGQTSGVWYFTFAGVNNVLTNSDGSQLVVSDTDIVRLTATDASNYRYSVFFRGSSFGLSSGTNEGIDAFTFTNSGQIIISTRGTHSVNTTFSSPGVGSGTAISGFGEDLIRFTPSAPNAGNGIQGGTWSRFFDGSRVGLSGSSENVDAVSIIYNAAGTAIDRILLSTTGTALVTGGISANPQDVLAFKPTTQTSLGAATAGTYNRFFVGTSEGLTNPTLHNVDALFYQRDPVSPYSKPKLFISTTGNFTVSGSGSNNDIAQFDATGGGPTGQLAGDFAAAVALRGSSFGQGTANTTGFWQGTTTSDPNPFGTGTGTGTGASIGLSFASAFSSASSFVADSSAQVALALPAAASTAAKAAVTTSISSKTAQAVSTSNNAGKVVAEQADSFFANSKRTRSSAVASLAKNLLARFK